MSASFGLSHFKGNDLLIARLGWILGLGDNYSRLNAGMAFDEGLAQRVREGLSDQPDLVEKKMFGGVGFMVLETWPAEC